MEGTKADINSWAGDHSTSIFVLMFNLDKDLSEKYDLWWVGFVNNLAPRYLELSSIDVIKAVKEYISWRLKWLKLENKLNNVFYSYPEKTKDEILDEILLWASKFLENDDLNKLYEEKADDDDLKKLWDIASSGLSDLKDAIKGVLTKWMEESANIGGSDIKRALGVGISFDIRNTRAEKFLEEFQFTFSQKTAFGIEERIRKILIEGVARGSSIVEVGKEIGLLRNQLTRFESERIARTEIIRAYGIGQLQSLDEIGAKTKQWITANDEKVCPICAPRHLQIYSINDHSVIIPAHTHCRCAWGLDEPEFNRLRSEILSR